MNRRRNTEDVEVVIATLKAHGALSRREIREFCGLGRQQVSRVVDSLDRQGVIHRLAAATNHPGRPGRYELTGRTASAKGSTRYPEIPLSSARFDGLLEALGDCSAKAERLRMPLPDNPGKLFEP